MATKTFPLPGGDVRVTSTFWVKTTRFGERLTKDCYCSPTKGTCLEPVICDGDMLVVDSNRIPEPGEFAVFWRRDSPRPSVKRLVHGLLSTIPVSPKAGAVELVVFEQLNPPKQYGVWADEFEAIHTVVGWMKPEEYEPARRPVGVKLSLEDAERLGGVS